MLFNPSFFYILRDHLVFQVKAMDLDSGPNGEIVYEIIDGDKRTFRIDPKTGEVTLKQTLTATKYELTIEAKDKGIVHLFILFIKLFLFLYT